MEELNNNKEKDMENDNDSLEREEMENEYELVKEMSKEKKIWKKICLKKRRYIYLLEKYIKNGFK